MQPHGDDEYTEYLTSRLPRLHRTAYLLCGDAHRADDIVQATALTLYLKWSRVRTAENIDGYVHRMLVREFLGQRRLAWARVLLTNRIVDRAAPPGGDVEERDAVLAALAHLAPGQRAVLVLRFFSDLSVEATAAALDCSPGNVKSQTARGLATLRRLMSTVPDDTKTELRSTR
jgi:RNA polymerase sigma-70 factor (sigma-E family)